MSQLEFRIVNWNIAGAKYLELKKRTECKEGEESREDFKKRLNVAIKHVIHKSGNPHVLTLQEICQYTETGDINELENVIDIPEGYYYYPNILINTKEHSHQGKWKNVKKKGNWGPKAYFGQGNAFLVRKDVSTFPIFSLPDVDVKYEKWLEATRSADNIEDVARKAHTESILLQSGIYLGNRDTEPRVASVLHIVMDRYSRDGVLLKKPIDIFIINVHLTTLTLEREGVPEVDKYASEKRIKQLDIIFDGIISAYNRWRKEGYPIRDEKYNPIDNIETIERHNPIWLLSGDFNFTQNSNEYIYIKNRNFLDLIFEHRVGTKAAGLGKKPKITLDFVFAGPLFESIDLNYILDNNPGNKVLVDNQTRVSDHFPVLVTLPVEL